MPIALSSPAAVRSRAVAPAAVLLTLVAGLPLSAAQDENLGTVDRSDGVDRRVSVWAAPGLTQSPVSFTISPDGRIWVAESDRAGNAVTDTRQLGHLDAVWEDGQLRTVEDRRDLIQRWIDGGHFDADFFTRTEDRVRMVADTDGDGVADTASVFAGGFNETLDGIGSGAIWVGDTLYYTNIPHLWALRDVDGDGRIAEDPAAGERTARSTGYGIRWCFYGHDLHGLVHGPDGRLWFSVGDRGFNITTLEGDRLVGADRGGVFRCWPDGTGLELVHEGLRNPQELAFDVFGNLFTGDNNCDSGDRARVTLILDGADSGWRQDVQSLPSRGPWNREKMWHVIEADADLVDAGRPAWVLPPIAHVGAGPSGFALQPGTGESGVHRGRLMLVDFYGSGAIVHSFGMEPRGAWFGLTDPREYYRGATVTDIAWGPDGRLYMTDWGGGWSPNPNGRVLVVTNQDLHGDPARRAELAAVEAWIGAGAAGRETAALMDALGHADHRIRQAAQMELARRGGWRPTRALPGELTDGAPVVRAALTARIDAATDATEADLGAVHAAWALGQIARRDPAAAAALLARAEHPDDVVRAQVLRTLAEVRVPGGAVYAAALADAEAPGRAAAVAALGRTGATGFPGGVPAAIEALLDLASRDADGDPVMRHSIAIALARIAKPAALAAAMDGSIARTSEAARLSLVIALRRQAVIRVGEDVPGDEDPVRRDARTIAGAVMAAGLTDPSVRVAAEAARAIYDLHLGAPEAFSPGGPAPAAGDAPSPFAALAAMLDDITSTNQAIEPLVRRSIEAGLRLAHLDPAAADRLVRFAARSSVPAAWRMLALERLEAWGGTDRRERVWGHWIPRPARSVEPIELALAEHEQALLDGARGDEELRFRVDRIRARLLLRMSAEEVRTTIRDAAQDPRFRAVLLEEATRRYPDAAADLATAALELEGDAAAPVRIAAIDVLARGVAGPQRLLSAVQKQLDAGTVPERQHAARRLGELAAAVDGPVAEPAADRMAELLAESSPAAAPGDVGSGPDAIRLELYRGAIAAPEGSPLREAASAIDAGWSDRRPAGFADALLMAGGDPERGQELFRYHEAAQCVRCHEVRGIGGVAGPRLTAVGTRLNRAQLVEAIVEPGRTIAAGYGRVAAMPVITDILSPEEVRDVVAYLADLDNLGAIRPAGAQIRAERFLLGAAWHVVALLLAVAISVVVVAIPRRTVG